VDRGKPTRYSRYRRIRYRGGPAVEGFIKVIGTLPEKKKGSYLGSWKRAFPRLLSSGLVKINS
jgi:hypothetical protein